MSTKQLLAEIERGINALQKANALVLKAEAVAPKAKATAAKTAPAKTGKVTKVPAKKAAQGGMHPEGINLGVFMFFVADSLVPFGRTLPRWSIPLRPLQATELQT